MEIQLSHYILGAVGAAAVLGLAVYFLLYESRKRAQILDRLAQSLGFHTSTIAESICPAIRKQSAAILRPQAVIQGEREGIPIEVTVDPGRSLQEGGFPTTSALFVWPKSVTAPGRMARISPMAGEAEPKPKSDLVRRLMNGFADDPTFGWSYVQGAQEDLDRVFTPVVRAKLQSLPRPVAIVWFSEQSLEITWKGVEEDPELFEETFKIGIACLESLAPR